MKKKLIILCICLVILGIGIFVIFKLNSNTKISEPVTVHNITFFDAKISKKGKKYNFFVKLDASKDVDVKSFHADIKDKNGKTIEVLVGYIENLNKNDSLEVNIETDKNLKKAYQISYSVYNQ